MGRRPVRTEERFWKRVQKDANAQGCWLWDHKAGHMILQISLLEGGGTITARRYSYLMAHGSVPQGRHITPICGNARCVRPDHLDVVQRTDEPTQRGAYQKAKTGCPRGHPYDEANTYRYRGSRYCRACRGMRPATP